MADSVEWGELVYYDVSVDGDVIGMDRYHSRLVRIRRSDGLVTNVGRQGEGPGEIRVGGIVAFAGDRLVMSERGRISVWDSNGSLVGGRPIGRASELAAWDSSTVIVKMPTRAETGLPETFSLHHFDTRTLELSAPFFESRSANDAPGSVSCSPCEVVRTADRLMMTLNERSGRYAVLDPVSGDITFFRGSGRERVPFSEEEWEEYMTVAREHGNYLFAGRGLDIRLDLSRPLGTPDFPKPMLAWDGSIGSTPDGRLWLLAGVPDSARTQIDVFRPEGGWEAVVRLRERLERIAIGGWWLVGLAHDDLGRPRLFRYDLREALDEDDR